MKFRTDINGLRAVAVLSVLFYHFGVPGFGGGYVGVDVFFVISGFLMTQIIWTKLEAEKFSLVGFYAARARRIVPALAVMTMTLLAFGYFYLTPWDYKWLGRHALDSLTFISNIVFSHKGDYFDQAIRESWLLHTWSLSVEWQFYLLFPLYLRWLRKYKDGKYKSRGVPVVLGLSLLLSAFGTPHDPTSAFYILPTRAWEFMAGGLVFLLGDKFSKTVWTELIGLLFILFAAVLYDGTMEFPGYVAVLPVAGAALVIAAARPKGLLSNPVAQFFGAISYSLYLWHWPVMRAGEYFGVAFTPAHVAGFLAASTALAGASYYFVERPFREMKKGVANDRKFLIGAVAVCAVFSLMSYAVYREQGMMSRMPLDVRIAAKEIQDSNPRQKECMTDYKRGGSLPQCVLGAAQATPSVALWGDSHADAVFTAVADVLKKERRAGIFYGSSGCPPVLGVIFSLKWKGYACKEANQVNYDTIMANPRIKDVLMVSRWSVYLHGYNEKGGAHQRQPLIVFKDGEDATPGNLAERAKEYADNIVKTACSLEKSGRTVYLVKDVPEMRRNVPNTLAISRLVFHRDDVVTIPLAEVEQRSAAVNAAFERAHKECGARVLDPIPYFCKEGVCTGVRYGKPMYFDDNHLSDYGNTFLKPMFLRALRR